MTGIQEVEQTSRERNRKIKIMHKCSKIPNKLCKIFYSKKKKVAKLWQNVLSNHIKSCTMPETART